MLPVSPGGVDERCRPLGLRRSPGADSILPLLGIGRFFEKTGRLITAFIWLVQFIFPLA